MQFANRRCSVPSMRKPGTIRVAACPTATCVAPVRRVARRSHTGSEDGSPSTNNNQDSNMMDSWDIDTPLGFLPSTSRDAAPAQQHSIPIANDQLLFSPWALSTTLNALPGIDLLAAAENGVLPAYKQVFVILFGVGEKSESEGIYSLRAFGEDGLPSETIIVFECEEDATRYAGLLEATMSHAPSVCSIPPAELVEFCGEAGYRCRMEPAGSLLYPPDYNVGVTDWERSKRLREGQWSVLNSEPEVCVNGAAATQGGQLATLPATQHLQRAMSDAELNELRGRLEALLPPPEDSA